MLFAKEISAISLNLSSFKSGDILISICFLFILSISDLLLFINLISFSILFLSATLCPVVFGEDILIVI